MTHSPRRWRTKASRTWAMAAAGGTAARTAPSSRTGTSGTRGLPAPGEAVAPRRGADDVALGAGQAGGADPRIDRRRGDGRRRRRVAHEALDGGDHGGGLLRGGAGRDDAQLRAAVHRSGRL